MHTLEKEIKEVWNGIKENRLYDTCADNYVILKFHTETSRDIVIKYEIVSNVCSKSVNVRDYMWFSVYTKLYHKIN